MKGEPFIALACICVLTFVNQVDGGVIGLRNHSFSVVPPLKHDTTHLKITEVPIIESESAKKSKLQPRLASPEEMEQYELLVYTSIKKSDEQFEDEDLKNLRVDDIKTARIKRPTLPSPFTTDVMLLEAKFDGHLPKEAAGTLSCKIIVETLETPERIDRIVYAPTQLLCSRKKTSATENASGASTVDLKPLQKLGSETLAKHVTKGKNATKISSSLGATATVNPIVTPSNVNTAMNPEKIVKKPGSPSKGVHKY